MHAAHAVPARPRPDRALQGVPAAEAQDAGVRGAGGRPLPHAADPHARGDEDLAHRRAGAAAQRGPRGGDRARARRRPPAVRAHRRGACWTPAGASASGAGSATTSTRCGWSTCWRTSTSPSRCATGSCATRPARASRRRSRARSCGWWTGSPTSTTTSTTRCAPACSRRATCRREEIAVLGDTGSRRIDTLVHDLVEHSERAGDIVQGDEVGAAMLRLRTFMFERVYLGPAARAEHAKIERVLRGLFDWYCEHPEELPRGRAGRLGGRPRDRLPGRHDRPLRHPRLDRALRAAGLRGVGRWRATRRSPARRSATRSTSRSSSARARSSSAPGTNRLQGLCPFHEERTPSFGIDPVEKLYHCFGCGAGGDVFSFVMETEGLDFGAALEWLAERSGVELERESEDPRDAAEARAARPAAGAAGAHRRLLRARAVGERRGGAARASTCSGAGSTRRRCASSGSATRRRAGTAC